MTRGLESQGVVVYPIELESADSVREAHSGRARGVLIPETHSVVSEFNANYVPRSFVLDPAGRTVHKDVPAADVRAVWEAPLGHEPKRAEAR